MTFYIACCESYVRNGSCFLLEDAQQEIIRLDQQQVFSKEIEQPRDGFSGDKKALNRGGGIYITFILTLIKTV